MRTLLPPTRWVLIAMAAICLYLIAFPPDALSSNQLTTLIVLILTLALWATSSLPEYQTSLLFFVFALLFEIATPTEVFSGFASGALWLVFAGMVIGMAIALSGLSDRLAFWLSQHINHSYPVLISGLVIIGTTLGFVMPSSIGRLVMMIPIGLSLAKSCGFSEGSQGRSGIIMAIIFSCHLPTYTILPSNIPNMVMAGSAETIYGMHFSYTDYLLLHFPILGLLKAIIIAALVIKLFPAVTQPHASTARFEQPKALIQRQKRISVVLVLSLIFWLTDTWHGINPAWVGLAAATWLLLPKVGIVDSATFNQQMNVSLLIYIAGVLALGALVNNSGLGKWLAEGIETLLPLAPDQNLTNFLSLSGLAFLTGMFATLPGVPAVLTPLAGDLAEQTQLSVQAVIMTQVIGFSTILFPYQSGPLIVGMQLAKEPLMKLMKVTIPLTLITWLVLIPLDYLWWELLGLFNPS
jgi:anion transporter